MIKARRFEKKRRIKCAIIWCFIQQMHLTVWWRCAQPLREEGLRLGGDALLMSWMHCLMMRMNIRDNLLMAAATMLKTSASYWPRLLFQLILSRNSKREGCWVVWFSHASPQFSSSWLLRGRRSGFGLVWNESVVMPRNCCNCIMGWLF